MQIANEHALLPALHAADPTIDVITLAPVVLPDLGMREDMKALLPQRLDHDLNRLLGGEVPIGACDIGPTGLQRGGIWAVGNDVGVDRLRAEDRHLDALVPMGDGNPLGQRNRRMLGYGVVQRPEL